MDPEVAPDGREAVAEVLVAGDEGKAEQQQQQQQDGMVPEAEVAAAPAEEGGEVAQAGDAGEGEVAGEVATEAVGEAEALAVAEALAGEEEVAGEGEGAGVGEVEPQAEEAQPEADIIAAATESFADPAMGVDTDEEIKATPIGDGVTRQEIRGMAPEEQQRFVNAVLKMMENQAYMGGHMDIEFSPPLCISSHRAESFQAGTAPPQYLKFAPPYCISSHGVASFPGWNRAYLLEFEKALQAADHALGQNGAIGLPYWDWTDLSHADVFPAVIREAFGQLPEGLVSDDNDLSKHGYSLIRDDSYILHRITKGNIASQVEQALCNPQFWQAASTENRWGTSLEDPHNSVHVFCGFPMSDINFATFHSILCFPMSDISFAPFHPIFWLHHVKFPMSDISFAAFHPIFWLHHANIDRLLESYLQHNPNSRHEFEEHAWNNLLAAVHRKNSSASLPHKDSPERELTLFETPLAPFKNPWTGDDFMPEEAFDSYSLGYNYDTVPPAPEQQMREEPTLAVFKDVDVVAEDLTGRALQLHVFVVPKGSEWSPPADADTLAGAQDLPNYAGTTAIFAGRGAARGNSQIRAPITVWVPLSDTLEQLGLSRFDVELVTVVEEHTGEVVALESTSISAPMIEGPYFEHQALLLQQGGPAQTADGAIPTENQDQGEVAQLQRYLLKYGYYNGEVDGVFGPLTEVAVRRLQILLGVAPDGVAGPATKAAMLTPRLDLHLDMIEDSNDKPKFEAQMRILWSSHAADESFHFEGIGSTLAIATPSNNTITLDLNEVWLLQGQTPRRDGPGGGFYILPVLLHEFGHMLGLGHSSSRDEVMSPFYVADRITLHENDMMRAAMLMPVDGEFAKVFTALDLDGDGVLSRDEFVNGITQFGSRPVPEDDANEMFEDADPSGAGFIDMEQFLDLVNKYFFS
eukprot:gene15642-21751_t